MVEEYEPEQYGEEKELDYQPDYENEEEYHPDY